MNKNNIKCSIIFLLYASLMLTVSCSNQAIVIEEIVPSELGSIKFTRKDFPVRKMHVRIMDEQTARSAFTEYISTSPELQHFRNSEFEISQTLSGERPVFTTIIPSDSNFLFIYAEKGKYEVSASTLDVSRIDPTPR